MKTCPSEEDEFKVSCNCAGEIWVDSACSQGFVCSGPAAQDGTNPGSAVECSPGSKISVTYFGNSVDSHGDISCQYETLKQNMLIELRQTLCCAFLQGGRWLLLHRSLPHGHLHRRRGHGWRRRRRRWCSS